MYYLSEAINEQQGWYFRIYDYKGNIICECFEERHAQHILKLLIGEKEKCTH